MTGFDYSYTSSEKMLELFSLSSFTGVGIGVLVVGLILILALIFYIIPHLDTMFKSRAQEAESRRKKQLMNKIVLQKNLEDVIAKELERGKT